MHKFRYGIERCPFTAQWCVVEYQASSRKLVLARFVDNGDAHRYVQALVN